MSTKITTCSGCKSLNIIELNPEIRETSSKIICNVNCKCNDCGLIFDIPTWTKYGRAKGILY
jgi:RNase P subunit RPR2